MYSEKLVVAIKHNDRVLRENGDTVQLPFGSEYSILIKNKNTVRAIAKVEIDGVDVTGSGVVVPPNGSIDLERFIKDGNLTSGNRFKFIERTKLIEDGPRGVQAEDGLVRVEFQFEQPIAQPVNPYRIDDKYWRRQYSDYVLSNCNLIGGMAGSLTDALARDVTHDSSYSYKGVPDVYGSLCSTTQTMSFNATGDVSVAQNAASVQNDVGITVPGSISEQKFVQSEWFPVESQKHAIVLKLLGVVAGKVVEEPKTVQTKPKCVTCGTVNKGTSKFCRECGTSLTIV